MGGCLCTPAARCGGLPDAGSLNGLVGAPVRAGTISRIAQASAEEIAAVLTDVARHAGATDMFTFALVQVSESRDA